MNEMDRWQELEKKLGLKFKNLNIITEALTHRSYLNEAPVKGLPSNERLEFLGDAVLSFWVSQKIFNLFPDLNEGKLTAIRTYLVRTETLALLSKKIGLGNYLLLGKGEEREKGRESVLLSANCFEAVIGAIFIDQGIESVFTYLERQYQDLFTTIQNPDLLKDSKSMLQEKLQTRGHQPPVYRLEKQVGPDHQRLFIMGVYFDNQLLATGEGRSKQEAEESAAKEALEKLDSIK